MIRSPLIDALNAYYDDAMFDPLSRQFFGGGGDHNMGYWTPGTRTTAESCDELFRRLMLLLPEKKGTILDVGCGLGANAERLSRHYPADKITAINISAKQIEACRARGLGCHFEVMDATRLSFDEASFDNVISVEAAFHFDTRQKFVSEARRVLKPGGRLVMTDTLLSPGGILGAVLWVRRMFVAESERQAERKVGTRDTIPVVNTSLSMAEYQQTFARAGFVDIEIEDITPNVTDPFSDAGEALVQKALAEGTIDRAKHRSLMRMHKQVRMVCRPYVLVSARRPAS